MRKLVAIQLIRFAVVGAIATLTHLTLSLLLILEGDFTLISANIIAFVVVFSFSYFTNTSWSFSTHVSFKNFKKYLCVALGNVLFITIVASLFDKESNVVGVVIIAITLPIFSFTLQKWWVYKI
ncbi:GtrA family protein [Shewanella sp. KX20019]|uniref:GtrA family protein n=1 Tax=Shewanella sp. KX20019 TaxID=2803864 RepID=UPI0019290B5D|nr:GtrA family protein [Shewanella sp. KX20019]QQX82297.1 GtrA family protein [Shewanella sp. KX20019]